ncbi:FAD-dependent oxidoreductase [Frankia sp. AgB32]|uniref:FAD-dependent oxidoreductase n=1 Tax=Frankia sp. AgB32 TaxID=631119 RepID=UPI00200E64B9|nr:FAD-dependent oxidoreductase [Frankia sp. AgB32]MCK9893962.1 FAD-dependent oxidoreductase [Frankia sp. AgB32]
MIGAGVAGCLAAIMRARAGYEVVLIEREFSSAADVYPVCTQTSNIVSENHSGAEYPFDPQSARDCLDGRIANEMFFPKLIYGGKTYSRIIASQTMMNDGHDIVGQCRANMDVLRSHYARRCAEDESAAVFGDPSTVCRELEQVDGVNDVARAFLTPQRGLNPVLVSTVLEWELRTSGVDFREGCQVTALDRRSDGRYRVAYTDRHGRQEILDADQISLCSATSAFGMAKSLNSKIDFPDIYMALREVLYVDLPDGTEKNFTCLKLEDSYGGMFSPISPDVAMIYHPPSAHIMNARMNPVSGAPPDGYLEYLSGGHPEAPGRAVWALHQLRRYYPELRRSSILGSYLKIAVNTVSDSRVRRNIGVFSVLPGVTMTVLPKWTMCVENAREELRRALEWSVAAGNVERDQISELNARAGKPAWSAPPAWAGNPAQLVARATSHTVNMQVPPLLADAFTQASEGIENRKYGLG